VPEELNGKLKTKAQIVSQAFKHDGVVITSYEFLRSDLEIFLKRERGGWFYVILDEA